MIWNKLFLILFFSLNILKTSLGDELTDKATQLMREFKLNPNSLGLYVVDDKQVVLSVNEDALFVPASLTKIVTAAALLRKWPMNTKFTTELQSAGKIEGAILNGELCFKGGGDPSFVSEKLWFLVNEFYRLGIKEISGDLIMDATRFDQELFDNGRDKTRIDRAYDAPVSAASFNWNSVNVFVSPGPTVGSPVKIFLDPLNDFLKLENTAITAKENGVKSIVVSRESMAATQSRDVEGESLGPKEKIVVTGKLSLGQPEFVAYKSIGNPIQWTAAHVREFLLQRGIKIKGQTKIAECLSSSVKLAGVESKGLSAMISDMLKFSNNYVAEMLVKNLGVELDEQGKQKKSATMRDGIAKIDDYLKSLEIEKESYVLKNVSGLTRENKFSAKQISKALIDIKNDFTIFPEFLTALPIAGVDGTLKNRLKGNEFLMVRAKTGYLDGVAGLGGYVGRKNKSPLIFVFLYNGDFESALASRSFFDRLVKLLL